MGAPLPHRMWRLFMPSRYARDKQRWTTNQCQLVVQTRQVIPSGAYLDRDCFVAVLLAMTSTYAVIASEAKQSRRGPVREQASGLHH